jgi:putative membrane protein
MRKVTLAAGGFALSLLTACGAMSGGMSGSGTAAAQLAQTDRAFVERAAQNGLAEVEGSKVALEKTENARVRGFAQQMVEDHTKTNQELASLAAAKGIDPPTEPSSAQRAEIRQLSGQRGDDFDMRYVEVLGIQAHQDTINLFHTAATQVQDPELKAFAKKTLPALQHHLEMARDLRAEMSQ